MAFKAATHSRHNTRARHLPTLTIADYVAAIPSNKYANAAWGRDRLQIFASADFAKRMGWAVRTDPQRRWVKVWDKYGNVTFANRTQRAVFSHWAALQHCKEYSHALIRMFIERA